VSKTGRLREKIKDEALQLGFELFGVTTPDAPFHLDVYEDWLGAGRHGEMGYLANERAIRLRNNPHLILQGCKSIIVLGTSYPAAELEKNLQGTVDGASKFGRVSSYAWGSDYHLELPGRMGKLVEFIEQELGRSLKSRWYTDTGPILERELAQRAGLGWIGKNTCLINPQKGSYFFLSEIFLDLELAPDNSFEKDQCGICRRCIEACPTACILPDRTIDSRKCISYLTIELKNEIPNELRSNLKEWVFGCDICQLVCPWNIRFAPLEGDPSFAPREGIPHPNLLDELDLTPEAFNQKFRGNPIKRTKRRGYLRNVAVAFGNSGDRSAIPILREALFSEPEMLVRGHCAWALGIIRGENAYQALLEGCQREAEPYVVNEIQKALHNF
jgi:epoxyqueuosine reductase